MENTKQWNFVKELRKFGEPEMNYLREVLDKGAMSIFEVENGMVERFEKAFALHTGAKVIWASSASRNTNSSPPATAP